MKAIFKQRHVLPGFGLSLGFTMFYLSLIVLIPLSGLFFKSATLDWPHFLEAVASPRVVASYKLSVGASLIGAVINAFFGLIAAWVLVRYSFPGRRLVDAIVDLPFALPTAVAGIALKAIYAPNGWTGSWLSRHGIQWAYSPLGVMIGITFIGLSFVVRTQQTALAEMDSDIEEAAASPRANRWQTFIKVISPTLWPAW